MFVILLFLVSKKEIEYLAWFIIFSVCEFLSIYGLFFNIKLQLRPVRSALIIDDDGITDCIDLKSIVLIKWNEIDEIKIKFHEGSTVQQNRWLLLVFVNNLNKHTDNLNNIRKKCLSLWGTPFIINCNIINYNNENLASLLNEKLIEKRAEINLHEEGNFDKLDS